MGCPHTAQSRWCRLLSMLGLGIALSRVLKILMGCVTYGLPIGAAGWMRPGLVNRARVCASASCLLSGSVFTFHIKFRVVPNRIQHSDDTGRPSRGLPASTCRATRAPGFLVVSEHSWHEVEDEGFQDDGRGEFLEERKATAMSTTAKPRPTARIRRILSSALP